MRTSSEGRLIAARLVVMVGLLTLAAGLPSQGARLPASRLRRPDYCREQLPRRLDELAPVVVVGRVQELSSGWQPQSQPQRAVGQLSVASEPQQQQQPARAVIFIQRVLRGPSQLAAGASLAVLSPRSSAQPAGGQSGNCPTYVHLNDTLIFLLELPERGAASYELQASRSHAGLFPVNLYNLERLSALASQEAYRRRAPIQEILCEAHYCAYGRCLVDARTNETSCRCPESCPDGALELGPARPTCGSDNSTYASECHLIREGCRRQRPLFAVKEAACDAAPEVNK